MTDRQVLADSLSSGCIEAAKHVSGNITSGVLDLQGLMPILHAWNLPIWQGLPILPRHG